MTPEEILDLAAEYISQHGWCTVVREDAKGRVCLEGALVKASGAAEAMGYFTGHACGDQAEILDDYLAAYGRVAGLLVAEGEKWTKPWMWNDFACKDADDAIHLLKRARDFR